MANELYYAFTPNELEEISDIIADIRDQCQIKYDNIADVDPYNSASDNYNYTLSTETQDQLKELNGIINKLDTLSITVKNLADEMNEVAKPYNYNYEFVYEPVKLNNVINEVKEALNWNSGKYRSIGHKTEPGSGHSIYDHNIGNYFSGFSEWERRVRADLDNSSMWEDGVGEELKEHSDEAHFEHNIRIINDLNEYLQNISFIACLDNMEDVKNKLDELHLLDDFRRLEDIFIDNEHYGDPKEDIGVDHIYNAETVGIANDGNGYGEDKIITKEDIYNALQSGDMAAIADLLNDLYPARQEDVDGVKNNILEMLKVEIDAMLELMGKRPINIDLIREHFDMYQDLLTLYVVLDMLPLDATNIRIIDGVLYYDTVTIDHDNNGNEFETTHLHSIDLNDIITNDTLDADRNNTIYEIEQEIKENRNIIINFLLDFLPIDGDILKDFDSAVDAINAIEGCSNELQNSLMVIEAVNDILTSGDKVKEELLINIFGGVYIENESGEMTGYIDISTIMTIVACEEMGVFDGEVILDENKDGIITESELDAWLNEDIQNPYTGGYMDRDQIINQVRQNEVIN